MMNVMMILSQLREHTRRGPPSQPPVRLLNLGAALGFALRQQLLELPPLLGGQHRDLLRGQAHAPKFARTIAPSLRRSMSTRWYMINRYSDRRHALRATAAARLCPCARLRGPASRPPARTPTPSFGQTRRCAP